MATGDRCAIYGEIDRLKEAKSVKELTAKLCPILNQLAYLAVIGEGAVLETQEEWHDVFADRLYAGHAEGQQQPRESARKPSRPKAPEKPQNAPALARPRAGELPPSLRAILDGTHPSFGVNEGYEGH